MSETTHSPDSWVPESLAALRNSLDGTHSPIEFLPGNPAESPGWTLRADVSPGQAAAIVRTSGSTGTPKQTLLSADALQSSAQATAEALGGHGQWLLTLQPSYVAGLAVLSRSLMAGTTPVPLLHDTTDPVSFTRAAMRLESERRYVSLVPTQLQRLLDHVPADADLAGALRRFDVILLGGGPSSPALLETAARHGLTVVRTYGMSETSGGCVYDGRPLPGVRLSAEDSGRVRISGPMVASGYLGDEDLSAAHFGRDPDTGLRSFLTDDLGEVDTDPDGQRLSISGRADDVIITGGVKVSAARIREALLTHPQVRDAFVGPAPDADWGQTVSATVVPHTQDMHSQLQRELQELVRSALGAPASPKRLIVLNELPLLANGKPDRQQLLQLLAEDPRQQEREVTPWQL
ncbi:AMP-binding protein [Nesterenkonia halotolerans]|uniref:AMP-binding protein n=1 Tax=Nesterenkonia halotolerans TaxID=225325 RepID=UPI00178A3A55|nr:AMP-binding protein [Nesterenkonia halotolerans]